MPCVCGHHKDSHIKTTMSVPLVRLKPPTYNTLGQRLTIDNTHPRATYIRDCCESCGCTVYEFDYGD